jgi:hypothetical protein
MFDVRQNTTQPCYLEKTSDGETWETFANLRKCLPKLINRGGIIYVEDTDGIRIPIETEQPDGTGDTFPTPNARSEISSDTRICLASANAANTIRLMHWTVKKNFEQDFLVGTASGLIGALAAAIFFPPSLAATLPVLIAGSGTVAIVLYTDFTEQVEKDLICLLISNATDTGGVVTFDYAQVLIDIVGNTPVGIWAVIGYYLAIIQEGGLNLAGATTAITEYDCGMCGNRCYVIDFTQSPGTSEGVQGMFATTYVSGQGYVGGYYADNVKSDATVLWTFPQQLHVVSVEVVYTKTSGSGASNVNNLRWLNPITAYNTVEIGIDTTNNYGTSAVKRVSINNQIAGISLDVGSGFTSTLTRIESMKIIYQDDNPPWSDNCTE